MTEDTDFILTNARVVLADDTVEGWVAVENGLIVGTGNGPAPAKGIDLDGDHLIPGLIELHTDHLEAHAMPRPKVHWDETAAVLAYDAQIVASGITTVFDSLRVGALADGDSVSHSLHALADAIDGLAAADLLRADHLTHLRCEIATPNVVEDATLYLKGRRAHLMSLMDHTPGQRQFRDLDKMRTYYQRHGVHSDEDFNAFVEKRLVMHGRYAEANRRALVDLAHRHGAALASHDDATLEQVEEAKGDRVSIAEFPTTREAATASHAAKIKVLMGAPNLVRGGSHSGNVAAEDLARDGVLDILSSDYVPGSLLMAAFDLPHRIPGATLAQAIRLVSRNPAEATGLTDRGAIAAGLRADLVRVSLRGPSPAVRQVWRRGARVF